MKLWYWVYKLSIRKIRDNHLKQCGDVKCPNCNEWFSISGVRYNHSHVTTPDFGFHLKCGQCEHESYWNAVAAPVLLLCDANGTPIAETRA